MISAKPEIKVATNNHPFTRQSARHEYSLSPRKISPGIFGFVFIMPAV
jgi:hypothetical protein